MPAVVEIDKVKQAMAAVTDMIGVKKELIKLYSDKAKRQQKTAASLLQNVEVYKRNIGQLESDIINLQNALDNKKKEYEKND